MGGGGEGGGRGVTRGAKFDLAVPVIYLSLNNVNTTTKFL